MVLQTQVKDWFTTCNATLTVVVVTAPALSTEMNTIGGNNEADEYFKGTDMNLYQLSWPGTWYSANITQLAGYAQPLDGLSPITSQTDAAYNKSEVFYLDPIQHVEALLYDNTHHTWSYKDITAAAGADPAKEGSPLVSLVNSFVNSIQVHYIDSAGHIHQLYSWDRTNWYGGDLTASTGALPAVSNSPLVAEINRVSNTVEVYYIGTDGHIRLLWWSSSLGWNSTDPTAMAGAPNPASGSALVSLSNTIANSVQLDYLTADHHIHELWWAPSAGWHWDDLTVYAGGVNAATGSSLTTEINTLSNTVELYYFDSNWNVKELWFNPGQWQWFSSDPMWGLGAPSAAPGSSLVSLVNTRAGTVQVHYIAPDKHVHELWWNGIWHTDDVTNNAGAINAVP